LSTNLFGYDLISKALVVLLEQLKDLPPDKVEEFSRLVSSLKNAPVTPAVSLSDSEETPTMSESSSADVHSFSDVDSDAPVTCNCKKSQCLKLYCQVPKLHVSVNFLTRASQCFAVMVYCSEGLCRCISCRNLKLHETNRSEAMSMILEINPQGFDAKMKDVRTVCMLHDVVTRCTISCNNVIHEFYLNKVSNSQAATTTVGIAVHKNGIYIDVFIANTSFMYYCRMSMQKIQVFEKILRYIVIFLLY